MANIDATIHSIAVVSCEINWSCAHPFGALLADFDLTARLSRAQSSRNGAMITVAVF